MPKFVVRRKWVIEAETAQEAIDKTKNWKHEEVKVTRIRK
jgi:hypothetical protein